MWEVEALILPAGERVPKQFRPGVAMDSLDAPDGVLLYTRTGDGPAVLAAVNLTASTVSFELPDTAWTIAENIGMTGTAAGGRVDIPAYGAAFFTK